MSKKMLKHYNYVRQNHQPTPDQRLRFNTISFFFNIKTTVNNLIIINYSVWE